MKKSARMQDYLEYLEQLLYEEEIKGHSYVDVVSKQLHEKVSLLPTLPTCCTAMKRMMKKEDIVIMMPNTQTGFGTNLHIRYILKNREEREQLYPLKKRGRKKGQIIINKKSKRHSLPQWMKKWLKQQNLKYYMNDNWCSIDMGNFKWNILLDIPHRGRKENFQNLFYRFLSNIENKQDKYSICIFANHRYEELWFKIPFFIKQQYQLSLLSCSEGGKIIEIMNSRNKGVKRIQ